MSTIAIFDLSPAGLDLFTGSESYINALSEDDMSSINGGKIDRTITFTIVTGTLCLGSFALGYITK